MECLGDPEDCCGTIPVKNYWPYTVLGCKQNLCQVLTDILTHFLYPNLTVTVINTHILKPGSHSSYVHIANKQALLKRCGFYFNSFEV